MQTKGIKQVTLHVADWNKNAMKLYLNNGFNIVKTEAIKREN
jgi:ribosomal protein S18 acetylase RimI-like enzyme